MAGRIAYYGNIVKDGLVFCVDAAKVDSYPGSGNIWRDISGFQSSASLTNGPIFNSSNYGSIVFDGTNDYAVIASTPNLSPGTGNFTYSSWINPSSFSGTTAALFVVAIAGGLWIGKNGVNFVLRAYGVADYIQYATLPTLNTWTNITITRSGTTATLYYNTTSVATGTTSQNFAQSTAYIGNDGAAISSNFNGRIATTIFYKEKALTVAEITQNYNAMKGRYGL